MEKGGEIYFRQLFLILTFFSRFFYFNIQKSPQILLDNNKVIGYLFEYQNDRLKIR